MADTELYDVANAVLAKAVTALGAYAPDRRYVHVGQVAWDCPDQLTVSPGTLTHVQSNQCSALRTYPLVVTFLKCVPTANDKGKPPSDTELDASALEIMTAGQKLWRGLVDHVIAGTLVSGIGCDAVTLGALQPLGPSGGAAGWSFTITLTPR